MEEFTVGEFLLATLLAFVWFAIVWIFIAIFADIVRRRMSGWAKAGWIVLIVLLPLVGSLVYVLTRPKGDVPTMSSWDGSMRYLHDHRAADEIARGSQLYDQGKLTDAEYLELKRRVLQT
jgi:hypothetical protein